MKCDLTELKGLKRKLNIQLSTEQVQKSFQENYKKWQKKTHLSGFRKGKVPFEHIRSIYQNEVTRDTLNDLLNEFYFKALEQNQLRPASQPTFDFQSQLKEGKEFQFSAILEIQPSITVDKSFKAQLKKPSEHVSEKELEQSLENLRDGFAKLETISESRGIQWGDIAECEVIELTEPVLGIPKKQMLEIKQQDGTPIKGLIEELIDMKPNETKKISVTFSNEYPQKKLAGKSADWQIQLISIKKKIRPEINNEFIKKIKCKDIDELKKRIKLSLQRDKQSKAHEDMRRQVLEQLTKAYPIPLLPEGIVKKQTQDIIRSHTKYLKSLNKTDKDIEIYNKKNENAFQQQANFEVHYSYILFALAEQLNISVSSRETEIFLRQNNTGKNKSPDTMKQTKSFLTCEKVIDYLIKTADIQQMQ